MDSRCTYCTLYHTVAQLWTFIPRVPLLYGQYRVRAWRLSLPFNDNAAVERTITQLLQMLS